MNADSLFQPIALGTLELPNRLIMTTVKLGYGTKEGEVTERHIAFYVRRAAGGVGLITTEPRRRLALPARRRRSRDTLPGRDGDHRPRTAR